MTKGKLPRQFIRLDFRFGKRKFTLEYEILLMLIGNEIHFKRDILVQKVLDKYSADLHAFQKLSIIPKTLDSLFILIRAIEAMKNSVFVLSETKNLYSINVLNRSLIEHFIRVHYVFLKSMEGKDSNDDSIGVRYFETLYKKEQLDAGNAIKKYASIINVDTPEAKKQLENFNNLKARIDPKSVTDLGIEFGYKSMIEYIEKFLNKEKSKEKSFMAAAILDYSELSSFVHGGRYAYEIMMKTKEENKLEHQLAISVGSAQVTYGNSVSFLFMRLMFVDTKFEKAYWEVKEAMNA